MTMTPEEYPEGKRPTCECSRRGTLATVVIHGSDRCARCYEVIEWVGAAPERIGCAGQMGLGL